MDSRLDAAVPPSYLALVAALPITGASIAIFDPEGRQSTVWASDAVAVQIEELQFDLGQGPHWRALAAQLPVVIADVHADSDAEWPLFGAAVRELDVGALFAFPVMLGSAPVGVVDMYRALPGALSQTDFVRAIKLCGLVARPAVIDAVVGATTDAVPMALAPAMRREVHQATGVVLVQLDLTATEAFFVLRAHAYSTDRTVLEVALDVLAGRLDFRDLPE